MLKRPFAFLCLFASATALFGAPTVTSLTPAASATVSSLTSVSVTFSEAVTGVDPDDLLVNSDAGLFVTGSGAGPYVFTFTQPPAGTVNLVWAGDHGIAGQAGTGAFVPSGSWTYTLTDSVAPAVATLTPAAGSFLAALTQVEVRFTEPVTGVDAADLLVAGAPATAVTGSGQGPYVFTFPQPATGSVSFAWAAGHGITDLAASPNPFAGGSWNATLGTSGHGNLVLTEFLASNGLGLADENGVQEDWIEIYNPGPSTVNLSGWALTNDHADLGQWVFPGWSLGPNKYLVVWASGNNRRPAQTTPAADNLNTTASPRLHTSFTLNENGGYLALVAPESPRAPATQYPADYDAVLGITQFPSQRTDYSYGLQAGDSALRFFASPTPGAANPASTLLAGTPKPAFNVTRGYFKDAFQLILADTDPTATIRYTTDFTEPTAGTGTLYTGPISISATTCVRAVAFAPGKIPSLPVTHSYLFLDQILSQNNTPAGFPASWGTGYGTNVFSPASATAGLVPADYEMDTDPLRTDPLTPSSAVDAAKLQRFKDGMRELPLVSMVIPMADIFNTTGLYAYPNVINKAFAYKKGSVEMILPDGSTAFSETCGISGHGNASRDPLKNPKHGFQIKFKGDYGNGSLTYQVFPDSPVKEFDDLILRPDFGASWRHWSDSANSLGNFQRTRASRFRDAFIKDTFRDMGRLASHHRFFHLFINGLYWGTYDFAEQPVEGFVSAHLGGDKADYSIIHEGVAKNGADATYTSMTAMTAVTTNALYDQMKTYLDVNQYVDYLLMQFFVGAEDWGNVKNWYAFRRRATAANPAEGKYQYVPWDEENTLLEGTIDRVNADPNSYKLPSDLHSKLLSHAQYKLDFADRVHRHMIAPGGALTLSANVARWQKWAAVLDKPIVAESCRWGDYRRDFHRYQNGTYALYTRESHWLAENTRVTGTYLPARPATVMTQLQTAGLYPAVAAPEFRLNDASGTIIGTGTLAAGSAVAMKNPGGSGTVYYTLDGNDPHVVYTPTTATTFAASGAPSALAYSGTLGLLSTTTTVKARVLSATGVWSALNEATFTYGRNVPSVRITELNYNPSLAEGGNAAEFIEIQNTGATPVSLGGWSFDGVDYVFPLDTILNPGGRLVLASNNTPAVFAAQFPGVAVFGFFGGSLDNSGERLALVNATGGTVTSVTYNDKSPWPPAPDGGGNTLEIINPDGDPNSPYNWKASNAAKGTPGAANSTATPSDVILSEFFVNPALLPVEGVPQGFVELANQGTATADLSGWSVNSDAGTFVFPAGSSLAPGAYAVLRILPPNTPPVGGYFQFGILDGRGGDISLVSSNGSVVDGVRYGPQSFEYGFSRLNGNWKPSPPTPGQANAVAFLVPARGQILSEWLANPAPGEEDWIEIRDISGTLAVDLTGLQFGVGSELFRLTAPSIMDPGECLRFYCQRGRKRGDSLDFTLPASGATLTLVSPDGVLMDSRTYGPQAEGVSQGLLSDPFGSVGTLPYPSPGLPNQANETSSVRLNEILLKNIAGDNAPWASRPSWIELLNTGTATENFSGWQLRDPRHPEVSWSFPTGVSVAPGAFLTVWADPAQPGSTVNSAHLNCPVPLVDSLELVSPSGYILDRITWGSQLPDLSIGRLGNGTWALLTSPTRGSANSAAAALGSTSSLKLSEWSAAGGSADFVELYNAALFPVALGGLYLSDDPGEVGRTKYRIPALSFVGPRGFITFGASGGLPGAFNTGFSLASTGEYLRLAQADSTPLAAVGFGLQTPGTSQGYATPASSSVVAFATSPGLANVNGTAPSFTSLPASQVRPATTPLTLQAAAANATSYQWQLNGSDLFGATSATYVVPSLSSVHDGVYTCVATGPGGVTTTSAPATVTVLHTYATWAAERGLAADSEAADSDGDGYANLAEFLANTDPLTAASAAERASAQAVTSVPAGSPAFQLDLRLNRRASYQGYSVQLATGPAGPWTTVTPASSQVTGTEPQGDQHWRHTYTLPANPARSFLRLSLAK